MSTDSKRATPIAVVGVSALFPGSVDKTGFWTDILAGRDLLSDVPETHWLAEDYYDEDPTTADHFHAKRGGFLPEVDFAPMDFGMPPSLLESTDSAQLLACVVAQKVLEDAAQGQFTDIDRERMSVILGVASTTELVGDMCSRLQRPVMKRLLEQTGADEVIVDDFMQRFDDNFVEWNEATFPGLLGNVVAGRVANRFDLGGTNMVVDAACASSLAAVEIALNELYLGDSDVVITGGVDCLNNPLMYMCFAKTTALSPTGDCRPFSDAADGTMLGEGVGMVALKRLADAEADGDRIYAVIRGLGSSSDGRAKSIYAPVASGQAKAMRRAYEKAEYGPDTVELVEAHGTGTKAGDFEEFTSVSTVFRESGRKGTWAQLGSVKSQIGHTKAAAGAAGLFKIVMALHHKVLPPTIKVDRPSSRIDMSESPFYLNTQARPWVRDASYPRRASVSAFGFGGTNFHVTAEEYEGESRATRTRFFEHELILLSGTPREIVARCREWSQVEASGEFLRWVARNSHRTFEVDGPARLSVVATADDLAAKLELAARLIEKNPESSFSTPRKVDYVVGEPAGEVAVLFPGQGSQYLRMGREASMAFDLIRSAFDDAISSEGLAGLAEVVFARTAFDDETMNAQNEKLRRTEWAQPAIGALSLGLWRLFEAMGLSPAAFAGHSYGEVTALRAAGAFDDDTFFAVSRKRGELMADAAESTEGAMTAVSAEIDRVRSLLEDSGAEVVIANHNSRTQVVVSGETSEIEAFETHLKSAGQDYKRLRVATAFHSPVVAESSKPFEAFLNELQIKAPDAPVYANSTAGRYDDVVPTLAAQISSPVRFVDELEALWESGARTFVEIGPGNVLSRLVDDVLGERGARSIATDNRKVDDLSSLFAGIGQLAVAGVELDLDPLWEGFDMPVDPRTVEKPKFSVKLNGANYNKPYPATEEPRPPVEREEHRRPRRQEEKFQEPAPEAPARTQVHAMSDSNKKSDEWLRAYQAIQEQTARAHAEYQRAIAENHNAFLRFAETSIRTLVEAQDGQAAELPNMTGYAPPPSSEPPRPQASANQAGYSPSYEPSQSTGGFKLPGAPADGASPAARSNGHTRPNGSGTNGSNGSHAFAVPSAPPSSSGAHGASASGSNSIPTSVPNGTPASSRESDLNAIMLDAVADKTGYPVDMLESSMELEADLGIDSIKRVEILSAVQDAAPELPDVDTSTLASLTTLGEIVGYLEELRGTSGATAPGQSNGAPASSGSNGTPASSRESPGAQAPSRDSDLNAIMLEAVADKTGYPIDMLESSMELEADLGIDSIKRVEILSAVQDAAPELPDVDTSTLASLTTLGEIVGYLEELREPAKTGDPPGKSEARRVVRLEATTRRAMNFSKLANLEEQRIVITDDARGVGRALAEKFRGKGHTVVLGDSPGLPITGELAPDAVVVTFGIEDVADVDEACALNRKVFEWVRYFAPVFESGDAHTLVLVQDTGGDFGFSGAGTRAYTAGIAALAKTASREFEGTFVKAIDLEIGDRSTDELGDALIDEVLYAGAEMEIALDASGARRTLALSPIAPSGAPTSGAPTSPPAITPSDTIVVSGGARGVTAGCVIEHARRTGAHYVLLGRTAPLESDPLEGIEGDANLKKAALEAAREQQEKVTPKDIDGTVRHVLATREINATLVAIEAAGASAEYVSVDVRDREALKTEFDRIRENRSITGLVHAAGVLADNLISKKKDDAFARVFDTKVDGLRALLETTEDDDLKFVALFSSVSARTGNAGQADYAMANEVLNKVSHDLRARGIPTVSIGWGPWDGGMVTPALKKHFESQGIELIGLDSGARAFADELESLAAGEIVVGGGVNAANLDIAANRTTATIRVSSTTLPDLADHEIQGKVVIPVAQSVDWLFRFGCGNRADDIRVLKGVTIEEFGTGLTLGAEMRDDRAVIHTDGIPLYSAEVSRDSTSLVAPELEEVEYLVTKEEFYSNPALFHGPAFQAVESSDGQRFAKISGARMRAVPESAAHPSRQVDVVALDSAFQLAVSWARHELGANTLPLKIGSVVWLGEGFYDSYRAVLEPVSTTKTRAISNLWLLSGDEVVARVEGLELFVIPSEA